MSSLKDLLVNLPPIRKVEEESYYETQRKVLLEICKNGNANNKLHELIMSLQSSPQKINIQQFLNEPFQKYHWTPLMMAVYNGHINVVYYLINSNASADRHRYKIDIYWKSPSGTMAIDLLNPKHDNYEKLVSLIQREDQRQERINKKPTKQGFHETSMDAFNFIINDYNNNKFPMIGGQGGYFGGGIYFAQSEEESSKKALHHGCGFECTLKMGNVYEIDSVRKLKYFYRDYCYVDYRDYDKLEDTFLYTEAEYQDVDDRDEDESDDDDWVQPYSTPCDVIQRRLLEDGYDSVWGQQNENIPNKTKRILLTGDEFVIYSADQIELKKIFLINKLRKTWDLIVDFTKSPQNSIMIKHIIPLSLRMAFTILENVSLLSAAFEPKKTYLAYMSEKNIMNKTLSGILSVLDLSDRTKKQISTKEFIINDKNVGILENKKFTTSLFSPDGSILCYTKDNIIMLKSFTSEKDIHIFNHTEIIRTVAFSRNGDYLFSKGDNDEFYIQRIDTKNTSNTYIPIYKRLENINASRLLASPKDNLLMVYEGDDTQVVKLYTYPDVIDRDKSQKELLKIKRTYTSKSPIDSFVFTPDGKYLLLAGLDTNIHFLNLHDKDKDTSLKMNVKGITCMTVSPNGHYLVAGFNDGKIMIWDIRNTNMISLVHISLPYYGNGGIDFVSFTKDGLELVLISTTISANKKFNIVQVFNSSKFT